MLTARASNGQVSIGTRTGIPSHVSSWQLACVRVQPPRGVEGLPGVSLSARRALALAWLCTLALRCTDELSPVRWALVALRVAVVWGCCWESGACRRVG